MRPIFSSSPQPSRHVGYASRRPTLGNSGRDLIHCSSVSFEFGGGGLSGPPEYRNAVAARLPLPGVTASSGGIHASSTSAWIALDPTAIAARQLGRRSGYAAHEPVARRHGPGPLLRSIVHLGLTCWRQLCPPAVPPTARARPFRCGGRLDLALQPSIRTCVARSARAGLHLAAPLPAWASSRLGLVGPQPLTQIQSRGRSDKAVIGPASSFASRLVSQITSAEGFSSTSDTEIEECS